MTSSGRLLRPWILHPVLIGAAACLVGVSGRTWAAVASSPDPVTGLAVHATLAGTVVAPAVRPVALAVLAGSGALLLLHGRARAALAALLALLGVGACFLALRAGFGHLGTAWPVVAALLALVCTLAAVAIALRAATWATPDRRRFEAPGSATSTTDADAWSALDRGEDPTA